MASSELSRTLRILWASLSCLLLIAVNCYESYKLESNAYSNVINIFSNLLTHDYLWKINEYLAHSVKSDNVEENLQKASELLEVEERRKSLFNNGLIKALQRFIKLSEIRDDNMCNMNSYSILLENNEAAKDRLHKFEVPEAQLSRVELIMRKKLLDHAIKCQKVYLSEYVKLLSKIDMNKIRKVRLFQDNIFAEFLFNKGKFQDGTAKSELIEAMNQLNSLKSKKIAHIAYDTIEELAYDDPDKKYLHVVLENKNVILRSDKVEKLFVKYLIEPCKYFLKEFNPIFIPYNYDRLVLKPEQIHQPNCEQEFLFLVSLSRHKLCKLLVEEEQKNLLKKVIPIAYNGGL